MSRIFATLQFCVLRNSEEPKAEVLHSTSIFNFAKYDNEEVRKDDSTAFKFSSKSGIGDGCWRSY